MGDERPCHGIIGNIPSKFHSADLRAFFSQFIEGKGFQCFHFRHRPEAREGAGNTKGKTTCCVVRLLDEKMDELIQMYHGQNWVDKAGETHGERAVISRIKVGDADGEAEGLYDGITYQTKAEKKQNIRSTEEFLIGDLKKLPELNPPPVMPCGNVGTPLLTFIELIRLCKFPPHLIKKLGLTFPRSKTKKYGNVPFDYGDTVSFLEDEGSNFYEEILDSDDKEDEPQHDNVKKCSKCLKSKLDSERIECESKDETQSCSLENRDSQSTCTCATSQSTCNATDSKEISGPHSNHIRAEQCKSHKSTNKKINKTKFEPHASTSGKSISDNESCSENESTDGELEDWERHEALHDDVDSQGRTKERLFENKIELKWEKGGSGLVWYTDAAFWKQREEADFDEETADDWDIDMGIYEEEGGGDKDAKDLLQMRVEKQWRKGKDIDPNRVGGFERFTRGIAGNVMRKHGWSEGQSLGSSQVGITEPVPADGQVPKSKKGLGYYGEKLDRHVKRPRATRDVVISTVYDAPDERGAELFQSQGPHTITYRHSVPFVPATKKSVH